MNQTRRDWLRLSAAATLLGIHSGSGATSDAYARYSTIDDWSDAVVQTQAQYRNYQPTFNMCGYAAPACENLRVGYIGLGNRGSASLTRLAHMEGVEIVAIADCYEFPIQRAKEILAQAGRPEPITYYETEETWRKLCERDDIDYIYIGTPPYLHAQMLHYAVECDKHAASEVPAAVSLEDCWKLVEASERHRRHCVMLENCCYDFFEILTTNMALQGAFGEIVHAEGAYLHYGLHWLFQEPMAPLSKKSAPYYAAVMAEGKGNRYPTHGFGPISQAMRIGRGDRLEYLTSTETDDFVKADLVHELASQGSEYHAQFDGKVFNGNMNISVMRSVHGKTMMIQYDMASPRPYSRIHLLSGLNGFVQKYPEPSRIYLGTDVRLLEGEELEAVQKQYTPELITHIGETAQEWGGHGGMDFTEDWRLVDCLRNGLPLDTDVYDAALWSSLTPLSLWSVCNRSQPLDIPDFTGGAWKTNAPPDFSLRGGGTTKMESTQSR